MRIEKVAAHRLLNRQYFQVTFYHEPDTWQFVMHGHDGLCDLTYIQEGQLQQDINGHVRHFGPGSLIWIREDDNHSLTGKALLMYNINFAPVELEKLASAIYRRDSYQQLLKSDEPIIATVRESKRPQTEAVLRELLHTQKQRSSSVQFHRFLVNTFIDYFLPLADEAADTALPNWLSKCMQHIDQNLENDLDPTDLIEVSGKSREHISRSFQKYLNLSLSQYINERKLDLAGILLSNTNRDILDICFSLGYNNPSYFYRKFKERYGSPPLTYRKQKSLIYSGRVF